MVNVLVGVIALSLLPGADARVASSLRAQKLSMEEMTGVREKASTQTFSAAEILSSAKISTKAKASSSTKAHQPPLMDGISQMRAEKCASREVGVSGEYEECLEFMVQACNPGPDMLMNGTPGEITSGHGWCTNFFSKRQAGGSVAASPAGAPAGPPAGAGMAGPPAMMLDPKNPGDVHAENVVDFPAEEERQVMAAQDMSATMDEVGELMKVRSETTDERKETLAALYWYEEELNAKLKGLDYEEYCKGVQQEALLVGEETSAPGMADMLAEMRCAMEQYSLPFYRKVVEQNLEMVRAEQKQLMQDIENSKKHKRAETVEDTEKEVEVLESVVPAAPEEKPIEVWSWSWIFLIIFIAVCLVCAFLAGRRLRQSRYE